ncbi:MAG: hypothetical protein AB7T49_04805 [Oligoflexales bacterium]
MMKRTIILTTGITFAAILSNAAHAAVPFCTAAALNQDSDAIGFDFNKKRILMDANNGVDVVDLKTGATYQLESLKSDSILNAKFDRDDRQIIALTQGEGSEGQNTHAIKIVNYEKETVKTISLGQFISSEVDLTTARLFHIDGTDDVFVVTFTSDGSLQKFSSFLIVDKKRGTVRKLIDDDLLQEIAVANTGYVAMDVVGQVLYIASPVDGVNTKVHSYDIRNQFVRTSLLPNLSLEGYLTFDQESNELVASVKQSASAEAIFLAKINPRRMRIEDQVVIARTGEAAATFWIEAADKDNQYLVHERYTESFPNGTEGEVFAMKIVDFKKNKVSIPECR